MGLQSRINYPARQTIFFQGKVWSFNKIEDFQAFIKKKTDLNREFAAQTQNTREPPQGNQEREEKTKNPFLWESQ